MKLYHYSDRPDLEFIDPTFNGFHCYTKSDTFHQLSYFYLTKEFREKFFTSASYRYSIDVSSEKIYDTFRDNQGLFVSLSTNDLITKLKVDGYSGLSFVQPSGLIIVALFYQQKIIEKEKLC